jgi:hypothetical protein
VWVVSAAFVQAVAVAFCLAGPAPTTRMWWCARHERCRIIADHRRSVVVVDWWWCLPEGAGRRLWSCANTAAETLTSAYENRWWGAFNLIRQSFELSFFAPKQKAVELTLAWHRLYCTRFLASVAQLYRPPTGVPSSSKEIRWSTFVCVVSKGSASAYRTSSLDQQFARQ